MQGKKTVRNMEKVVMNGDIKEISILEYYPNRMSKLVDLTPEQLITNQFVYNFKNGHRPTVILAAKIVASIIEKHFNLKKEQLTFVPIPASNYEDTAVRYNLFSYLVSLFCKVTNGHKWVNNWEKVDKKHLTRQKENHDYTNRWFVDYGKIKGAKLIVLDDVITTGETAKAFVKRIENCGGKVIGMVFLARTIEIKKAL